MELLWAALPMAGCALMMVLMMRLMAAGGDRRGAPPPDTADEQRREALEAEAVELRARLGDREPSSS